MIASWHRAALWTVFLSFTLLTAHGIYSGKLFEQELWLPAGLKRLAWFTGVSAVWALGLLIWLPRWFTPLTLAVVAGYAVLTVGPAALAACLLVLFSSLVLGRRLLGDSDPVALLLGLSVYMWVIGLAVHFPVNYPAPYLALLILPLASSPRDAAACLRECARLVRPGSVARPMERLLSGVLAFVLVAVALVAMKPEVSFDGLAMHLAVAAGVANHHHWGFDFKHAVWAVMPMGADWAYALSYMLGGEFAARLLNLGALLLTAGLLHRQICSWLTREAALLATALFVSTPLVQYVTGSLMVENLWAAMLFGAFVALCRFHESGENRWLYACAILTGSAMSVKYGTLAFAAPLAVLLAWELVRRRSAKPVPAALICFLAFATPAYLTAWWKTGNPIFPFANAVFKSPWLDSTVSLKDYRFESPLTWDLLYAVTFHTRNYMESQDGASGFQYLLLLPVGLLTAWRWRYPGRAAMFLCVVFVILTFRVRPNLRYLYPALPLFAVLIACTLASLAEWDRRLHRATVAVSLAVVGINFYFLAACGSYHRDFFLLNRRVRDRYLETMAPTRKLVGYLNRTHPGEPVLFVESNQIAGLLGKAYTATWHNDNFDRRLRAASSPEECLKLMKELGVRHFVMPSHKSAGDSMHPPLERFLRGYTTPEYEHGGWRAATLAGD